MERELYRFEIAEVFTDPEASKRPRYVSGFDEAAVAVRIWREEFLPHGFDRASDCGRFQPDENGFITDSVRQAAGVIAKLDDEVEAAKAIYADFTLGAHPD